MHDPVQSLWFICQNNYHSLTKFNMILWENILLLLSEELNHLKYYLDSLLQNVHYFVDRKHMAVKRSALYYTGIGQF